MRRDIYFVVLVRLAPLLDHIATWINGLLEDLDSMNYDMVEATHKLVKKSLWWSKVEKSGKGYSPCDLMVTAKTEGYTGWVKWALKYSQFTLDIIQERCLSEIENPGKDPRPIPSQWWEAFKAQPKNAELYTLPPFSSPEYMPGDGPLWRDQVAEFIYDEDQRAKFRREKNSERS